LSTEEAAILLLVVLATIMPVASVDGEAGYVIEETTYHVYSDGSVNVTYLVKPATAPLDITIALEAPPLYAEARINSTMLPVEYSDSYLVVTVYSTDPVKVSYIAMNMTYKSGEYWILKVRPASRAYVVLPDNALPVEFSPDPIGVVVVDGKIAFEFKPGEATIRYIVVPGHLISETATEAPGEQVSTPPSTLATPTTPAPENSLLAALAALAVAVAIAALLLLSRRKKTVKLEASISALDDRDKLIIEKLSEGPKTAGELMRETGIPKNPLYRRLKKLVDMGLVEAFDGDGTRKYRVKR